MGDPRRFDTFARLISSVLLPDMRIADVAGGKGYLQAALRERGFSDVVTWDRRRSRCAARTMRFDWFTHDTRERYDAVVAMHPDEGTDHALLYAIKHRIPAIICPCCVKPSALEYWDRYTFRPWCRHLESYALNHGCSIEWTRLGISGRNDVMIIRS